MDAPPLISEWLHGEMARLGYGEGDMSKFARSCDVHVSILWRVLKEGRVPRLDVLRRIANALGYTLGEALVFAGVVTADELYVDSQAAPPRRDIRVPQLAPRATRYSDPGEQNIWDAADLSQRERLMLIDFLRVARKHWDDRGGV